MRTSKKKAILLFATALALSSVFFIASPSAASTAPSAFPVNPAAWEGIAIIAVLLIIAIASATYMLSGLAGSSEMKGWSMNQITEGITSIILLMIFIAFAYLFVLNPVNAYSSIGILPTQCTGVTTIYSLAMCDIGTFTGYANNMVQFLFFVSFFSGLSPGFNVGITTPISGVTFSFSLNNVIPVQEENLLSAGFSALLFLMLLNQIQVLLISGALLFLSLFLTLGIIARTFGITRSFGGALIAFGLGLGLVYPLLVTITYGIINTNLVSFSFGSTLSGAIQGIIGIIFAAFSRGTANLGTSYLCFFPGANGGCGFIQQIGYLAVGLTFIPVIIFTILDVFIRDLSRLMGVQMEFMALLGGLL